MSKLSYPLIALVFAASAAQAQDSGAAPPAQDAGQPAAPEAAAPPQTPDAAPPVAAAATAATNASVTDAEVSSYADAMAKVQTINANAALDTQAKQQQMIAAVTEAGIEPARFNAISQALTTDTALRTRIHTALAAHSAAHEG